MERLLRKYVEMRALRRADEDGTLADPRPRMRALAAEFPGALREIDALPMKVIEARIAALERASVDHASVQSWMIVMARFHDELRDVLAMKRRAPAAAAVANPPRGRLSELVCARIAQDLGVSASDVRALIFGYES